MNKYRRKQLFSAAYIRFHKQVVALHEGKLRTVKQIASEAREELTMKAARQRLRLISPVPTDRS